MTGAIVTTAQALAEVPAAPLFGLAALAPTKPAGLAAVRIRPAPAAGRVVIEALGNTIAAALEVEGVAALPVTLPRWALLELRRRHRNAERVVIDPLGQGLRLVALAEGLAVALACGEVAALPELPNWEPLEGTARPLLFDPALLALALAGLREAAPGPVELRLLDHPVLGLELAPIGEGVAGAVAVARMQRTWGQPETSGSAPTASDERTDRSPHPSAAAGPADPVPVRPGVRC